jgi:hypothetical protein
MILSLDCRDRLTFVDMIANIRKRSESSGVWCAEYTARIALRLTAIGLCRSIPVDTAESMAAAGLYDSVAILPGAESGTKSDVKRDRAW